MDPLLVIMNSDAGGSDDAAAPALALLREATDVEVVSTSNSGELDGVLHRRGGRRVVVAGGDGSLHVVVAALHRRNELKDTVLGLLPLGTGNDFARGAGVPLDPVEAAEAVLSGEVRSMDLIVDCLGEVVVNNVHVGVGAQASRKSHSWKDLLGRLGYAVGALVAAVKPPFVRLRVEIDGDVVADVDQPVLQVALGNGATVGGGLQLNPGADPEDGRMDVMVSYSIGPLARLSYGVGLLRSDHHERDDVVYRRASTVTISGEPFYLSADGEVYGPERHRTWRIEPDAYRLSLPR